MNAAAAYALGFGASLAVTGLAALWTRDQPAHPGERERRQVELAGALVIFGITLAALTAPQHCRPP